MEQTRRGQEDARRRQEQQHSPLAPTPPASTPPTHSPQAPPPQQQAPPPSPSAAQNALDQQRDMARRREQERRRREAVSMKGNTDLFTSHTKSSNTLCPALFSADGWHHRHQLPEWPDGHFWREPVLRWKRMMGVREGPIDTNRL